MVQFLFSKDVNSVADETSVRTLCLRTKLLTHRQGAPNSSVEILVVVLPYVTRQEGGNDAAGKARAGRAEAPQPLWRSTTGGGGGGGGGEQIAVGGLCVETSMQRRAGVAVIVRVGLRRGGRFGGGPIKRGSCSRSSS